MQVSPRYSIGADFGTESGRVLLLNLLTGEQYSSCVVPYASTHGRSSKSTTLLSTSPIG
jgi:ribulose kinase